MSRLSRRPRTDHAAVADHARQHPQTWHVVGEYRSTQTAECIVQDIRTAGSRHTRVSPYLPAGAFEARQRFTEFGCEVQIKYVGSDAG
ncbi:hypothetical protein [Streptomyces sp. NPDC017941]|uniref:hypothetical protein n=1 Tax=Streptomyces sp. NPDC017941 TaxID=3365018 RepID=UPI0037B392A3